MSTSTTELITNSSPGTTTLAYQPLPDNFHAFPRLPTELQLQIWKYAAREWTKEFFERGQTWIVPSALKTLRPVLCHIKGDPRRGRQKPNLLWTCAGARNVLYDLLLSRDRNGLAIKRPEEEIILFLRRCLVRPSLVMNALSLGCRIQDFRAEGLGKRVDGERLRMKILQQELDDVRRKVVVQSKTLGCGYVRLPLFNGRSGCVSRQSEDGKRTWVSLYPALPTEKDEEMKAWREGVMMG